MNKWTLLIAQLVCIALMIAGWLLPLLTLKISVDVPIIGQYNLFNETRSIVGTMSHLFEIGKLFPASLILLFGILIPVAKTAGTIYALTSSNAKANTVSGWVHAISKWAMADVFAISILVAFLASNSLQNTEAILHIGFYIFAVYVLLSALLAHFTHQFLAKQSLDLHNGK
jgi:paraquat-inducible protein A